jgi:hypothetical protein
VKTTSAYLFAFVCLLAACKDEDPGYLDAGPGEGDAADAQTVDTVAPETTLLEHPAALGNVAAVSFTFSSDDIDAVFECRVDGAEFAACTSPEEVTVADGAHTFEVRAKDLAGNIDATPATFAFTTDTVAPETTIDTAPPSLDNSVDVSFGFAANEEGSTFECRLDGADWATCPAPHALTGLADGDHTFDVRARDLAGNIDPTPATHPWTIDSSTPDTVLDSGPEGLVASASASFEFSSPDAGTGALFQCSLDGDDWATCASPRTYPNLADGEHTFEVRVRDMVGNTDPTPASRTWTIDTVAPETTITGTTPASSPTNTTAASFTFGSADPSATFECSLDGATFAACDSGVAYATLAAGSHTFAVRARDAAGNADATPATHTWTIDLTAPETTITGTTPATSPTNTTTIAINFTSPDATATFQCSLDGGAYATCATGVSFSGLAAGNHTFAVRARDVAGNADATPATYNWTIDLTAPDTTITSTTPATSPTNSTSITVNFTSNDATATFECNRDNAGYSTCASGVQYTSLAAGAHTVLVRARDAAGNVDATPASYNWTIDTTAPDTTITSTTPSTSPTNSTSITINFSSNDAAATFECNRDGAGYSTCASGIQYTSLAAGAHTFLVRARDTAGNVDATPASYNWTIDTTVPDTTITSTTPSTSPTNSTSITINFSSNDATATFECNRDGAGYSTCASGVQYTSLAAGAHTFLVRARDAAGNVDATPASYNWTIDLTAPDTTITSTTPATSPTNSTSLTVNFTSNDATATFECNRDSAGYSACSSGVQYTNLAAGNHTVLVRARDTAGNVDATPAQYNWTIDLTVPDTTITSTTPSTSPTNSTSITINFSSNDATATFECNRDNAGYSACASGIQYTNLAAGADTFLVRARDTAGNIDATPASYNWTIDLTAPDTTITSTTPSTSPTNSTSITINFSSNDATATFECNRDNAGYSACASGIQYTNLAAGAHTFLVRARDTAGNVDATPASYNWTIDLTAPDTTLVSVNPTQNPTSSTSMTFTFSSNDATATFECNRDSTGYSTCTSGLQYTNLAAGAHTFLVRARDSAGNADATPASYNWTIDVTPPDTAMASITAQPWPVNYADFTLTAPGATDLNHFECRNSTTGAFTTCPAAYTATPLTYNVLNTIQARACDNAGNCDPTPAQWLVTPTAGLVVYEQLDQSLANSTTLADAHDAVATETYVTGQVGYAVNAGDAGVRVPGSARPMSTSPNGGYTIAAWEFATSPGTHHPIDFMGSSGCYVEDNVVAGAPSTSRVCCRAVNGPLRCSANLQALPQQGWRHLALIAAPTTQSTTLYVNGSPYGTLANTANEVWWNGSAADVRIGVGRPAYVDDVRLYNVALPQANLCTLVLGRDNGQQYCDGTYPLLDVHADGTWVNNGSWTDIEMIKDGGTYVASLFTSAMYAFPNATIMIDNISAQQNHYLAYYNDLFINLWTRDTTGATSNGIIWDMYCDTGECQGNGGLKISENGAGLEVCWGGGNGTSACTTVPAAVDLWHHLAIRIKQSMSPAGAPITGAIELFVDGHSQGFMTTPSNTSIFTNVPYYSRLMDDYLTPNTPPVAIILDELEIRGAPITDEMICAMALGSWNGEDCEN